MEPRTILLMACLRVIGRVADGSLTTYIPSEALTFLGGNTIGQEHQRAGIHRPERSHGIGDGM